MSLPIEFDELVSELAAPLEPPHRAAFISAAERALAGLNCAGLGLAYRLLAPIQRAHFDPPADRVAYGPNHHKCSKLIAAPAIGADDPRTGGRDRTRLRTV
jgi:hypothetical protein